MPPPPPLLLQLYVLSLSLVRIDVGGLVAGSLSVGTLMTLLLTRTGELCGHGRPSTEQMGGRRQRVGGE